MAKTAKQKAAKPTGLDPFTPNRSTMIQVAKVLSLAMVALDYSDDIDTDVSDDCNARFHGAAKDEATEWLASMAKAGHCESLAEMAEPVGDDDDDDDDDDE